VHAVDRLVFNTKTVIGAPGISGLLTTYALGNAVFDSENAFGLPVTGTTNGASFDISILDVASVPVLQDGDVLKYNQQLGKWINGEAASSVATLSDVSLLDSDNGNSTVEHRAVLVFDSDRQKWEGRIIGLKDLEGFTNVDLANLVHNDVVYWDSDIQQFRVDEIPITQVNQSVQAVENFVAIQNQRVFILANRPFGDVVFVRNGIVINADAITVDRANRKVTYDSDFNNFSNIDSDDIITIQYLEASATEEVRLGDLADVDNALLNPSQGDMLIWDSDAESWVGSSVDNSEMVCQTFTATTGQTNFVLSGAAVGDVVVSRNGATIPTAAVTLSVDGQTATYSASNNENEAMVAGDLVTITYLKGSTPRSFAPIAISNAPDVVTSGRVNSSLMYYDATALKHKYTTDSERTAGSILYYDGAEQKHKYVSSTGRTNGSILYYDTTTSKHKYTTDSDRLNGAILTWNSGHNAYKHITTTSMNAGNGQGTMMWWNETGKIWQGTPTPIFNTNAPQREQYKRKTVPVVFDYATQKTKYFNNEYGCIFFKSSTSAVNIAADSWIIPSPGAAFVDPGTFGTGSYFSNTSAAMSSVVLPGVDILDENPVYEVEVKLQVTPTGGSTWAYVRWKLSTYFTVPVDLGVSGHSWSPTTPSASLTGVPGGSPDTQKFIYTPQLSLGTVNRFTFKCVSAASSTNASQATFDMIGSYITWRRVG
jgi:hypothetical protein